jgi:hypothetical protein
MSSSALPSPELARPTRPQRPALSAVAAPDRVALRAELDALNEGLRVMKSTDHGVRAYLEMWCGIIATAVGGKLIVESAKVALFAYPLVALGLLLLADAASHKLTQRQLALDENRRLDRQRELRRQLGLDEVAFPPAARITPDA